MNMMIGAAALPQRGGLRHRAALDRPHAPRRTAGPRRWPRPTSLPRALAGLLVRRGVAAEAAAAFLEPTVRDLLPDPLALNDMGTAAARFLAAVRRRERIAVFADYDVDGGASAALLVWWLRAMGREATLYVPDRIDEGYGPNETAMAGLGRATT